MDADDRARKLVQEAISTQLDMVAAADRGTQNDTLWRASFIIGGYVGWVDFDQAEESLMYAARDHISHDGENKARNTIRRGLQKGSEQPFEMPEDLRDALTITEIGRASQDAIEKMRERAARKEEEAAAHREQARQHLIAARYLERVANALWDQSDALADLQRRGISEDAAQRFGVGYDIWPVAGARGPTTPSIVIPWTVKGRLRTTQYRHLRGSPRYHWHPDLGSGKLWNADGVLDAPEDYVVIVEGALTALTLCSHAFNAVGLPTISGWKSEYARWFEGLTVYWAPDAGAIKQWREYARDLPGSLVARLPADPDEYLVATNVDTLWNGLRYGEPVD